MRHRVYMAAGLLAVVLLFVSGLQAEVITEATLGSGYQGNLFNDANSTGDTYGSAGLRLKYYPSASAEFAAGASYNAFVTYNDLSSLTADASATFIPTSQTSPLTLAIAGNISYRKFGLLYELYDQGAAMGGVDMGYRIAPWAHLLGSASYFNSTYTNADYGSNRGVNASAGINLSLLGSNSIAIRADYSRRLYDQPAIVTTGQGMSRNNDQTVTETFEIAGVLLRFSRPLGVRTGLNLSFGHRALLVNNEFAVPGYTVDYLSPWSDLWEGNSVSATLKHFFPGQVTTEFSAAYFDKSYVDAIESVDEASDTFVLQSRDDQLTTATLSLARPILLQNGHLLTPMISAGYRQNASSIDSYDYQDFWTSLSLKVAF